MARCCTLLLYGPHMGSTEIVGKALTWGNGADAGTRTRNLPITSRERCQLRHAGTLPAAIVTPRSAWPTVRPRRVQDHRERKGVIERTPPFTVILRAWSP
jgi:hypothetical protein